MDHPDKPGDDTEVGCVMTVKKITDNDRLKYIIELSSRIGWLLGYLAQPCWILA